jgi:hypothetical protein
MTIQEAIAARHSVRSYLNRPVPGEWMEKLESEIRRCNAESGLHIQAVWEEPAAFSGFAAHYGKFTGVRNYFAMVGPKSAELEELCGYYGERLVLLAQTMGLSTCWVAGTFGKGAAKTACRIRPGEKLVCVIAVGYGAEPGVPHRSKPMEALCECRGPMPEWFRAGMDAALLAPTAINQQKFQVILDGDGVAARALLGPYSRIDLGIVKYHFEIGSGRGSAVWNRKETKKEPLL